MIARTTRGFRVHIETNTKSIESTPTEKRTLGCMRQNWISYLPNRITEVNIYTSSPYFPPTFSLSYKFSNRTKILFTDVGRSEK